VTGAAILVTIGVLFLLQQNWYIDFGQTWPVLLIVIGVCSYIAHNASTEGHVQPWWVRGGTPNQTSGQVPPGPEDSGSWQTGHDPQVKI
jgi:hypothetical protein